MPPLLETHQDAKAEGHQQHNGQWVLLRQTPAHVFTQWHYHHSQAIHKEQQADDGTDQPCSLQCAAQSQVLVNWKSMNCRNNGIKFVSTEHRGLFCMFFFLCCYCYCSSIQYYLDPQRKAQIWPKPSNSKQGTKANQGICNSLEEVHLLAFDLLLTDCQGIKKLNPLGYLSFKPLQCCAHPTTGMTYTVTLSHLFGPFTS